MYLAYLTVSGASDIGAADPSIVSVVGRANREILQARLGIEFANRKRKYR
jgi:hypothetical protein